MFFQGYAFKKSHQKIPPPLLLGIHPKKMASPSDFLI
jgi:hypothetical protein